MKSKCALVTGIVLLVLLSGCDLFKTRPTEPPLETGTPWIAPTQVDQLFANMVIAFAEMNSDHYLRCLFPPDDPDHSFLFVPNPNTANWPVTEPWDYDHEKQAIEYLFTLMSPDNPGYLMFGEGDELVYGNEDSVWVTKPYSLVVPLNDPNMNIPQAVEGTADFYLAKTDVGYWAIYRWEDLDGSPSWTELKAGLY